jgi:hypothetical protein
MIGCTQTLAQFNVKNDTYIYYVTHPVDVTRRADMKKQKRKGENLEDKN